MTISSSGFMQAKLGAQAHCQICASSKLAQIVSLGHQPIVQQYLTQEGLREPEIMYPLVLMRCGDCGLLQLSYTIDPEKVFPRNYPYRTGLTNMLLRNFEELAAALHAAGAYAAGDLIVDIGANDGSLLKPFALRGARVLGVEPTDAAKD